MIIVRLQGGLGNQLFQYAVGRSLALKRNTSLKLDSSLLGQNGDSTPRGYELHHFAFKQEAASATDLALFEITGAPSLGHRLFRKLHRGMFPRQIIVENISDPYRGDFNEFRGDLLLVGYWQTAAHFGEHQEAVRKDLQFRDQINSKSRPLAQTIVESHASFLHVRRGDYVQNSAAHAWHGACSEDYYHTALNRLRREVGHCPVVVFSDDPDWCRTTFCEVPDLIVADNQNSEGSTIDHLRLMSLCQNGIISNSSFSWWGAWLMNNPKKRVIAPEKWVADPDVNQRMWDITPYDWIRL